MSIIYSSRCWWIETEPGIWGLIQQPISRAQLMQTITNALLYTQGVSQMIQPQQLPAPPDQTVSSRI